MARIERPPLFLIEAKLLELRRMQLRRQCVWQGHHTTHAATTNCRSVALGREIRRGMLLSAFDCAKD